MDSDSVTPTDPESEDDAALRRLYLGLEDWLTGDDSALLTIRRFVVRNGRALAVIAGGRR